MKISTLQVIGGAVLMAALAACTQGAGTAQSVSPTSSSDATALVAASTPGDKEQSTDDDDPPITHIDCGKIFSPADMAGILDGQVTISVYPYRDNACHFESAAGSTFTLYSGNGSADQLEWKEAAANAKGDYEPVPGVGDQAFFGHGDLLSKKGDYYCAIAGTGGHPKTAALLQSLGALCNKIYAAR